MADEGSGKISDRVSFGGDQSKNRFIRLVAQVCVSLIFVASSSVIRVSRACRFRRRQHGIVYLSSIDLLQFSSSTRALEPAKEPSGKATCRENLCASVCFVSRRCWRGDIFFQESLPMFRFRNELWRLQNVTRQYRIGIGWRSSQICCLCPGWSIGSMMFMKRGWMSKSQAAPRASNGTLF